MKVSVVIPARDAAATLSETLRSVQSQTHADWEAIVVDDASTDETGAVARGLAAAEPRIRVVPGPGRGAGQARNVAVREAAGELMLFLDADDLIEPTHLELLSASLTGSPHGAAHCRWARLAPDGGLVPSLTFTRTGDLFPALASACWFPIHGCVVRTERVRAAGGFRSGLELCEDWDLWQRLARTGTTFAHVPELLALYRMQPRSLSTRTARFLADGVRVLTWAHGDDPLAHGPDGLRSGAPVAALAEARLMLACWVAGLELGMGGDAQALLATLPGDRVPWLDTATVADVIHRAAPSGWCGRPEDWVTEWQHVHGRLAAFLGALERLSGAPDLAGRALREIERRVAVDSIGAARTGHGGRFDTLRLETTEPLTEHTAATGASRLLCRVEVEGEALGVVELPVCDGVVPAAALADAVAGELSWPILARYFARTVYPSLRIVDDPEGGAAAVWRGDVCLGSVVGADDLGALHDAVGWAVLLQEVFAAPGTDAPGFYDPAATVAARTRATARSPAAVELAEPFAHLVCGRASLDVVATVGGAPLGVVRVSARRGVVSAGAVRAAVTIATGYELARVVVREAILGRPLDDHASLTERLRRAAGDAPADDDAVAARALGGGGYALPRRRPREIGGAASRFASLPVAAVPELGEAGVAGAPGQVSGGALPRTRAAYVPSLLALRGGEAQSVDETVRPALAVAGRPYARRYFETLFARNVDPWRYGNAYEQRKYAQTLALAAPGRNDRVLELGCAEGHFTAQLATRAGHVVAADISAIALERARARCDGLPNVELRLLDIVEDALPGGFDLIVCSEVLYYVGDRAALERVAGALADRLAPGGRLAAAHSHVVVDDPHSTGFDWDLEFGVRVIGETLARTEGLALRRELRTPLYRVQLLERLRRGAPVPPPAIEEAEVGLPLPDHVAASVRWGGARISRPARAVTSTGELPILMYHRVTDRPGAADTSRYRISTAAFETQLRYLRDAGYHGVSLREWAMAMRERRPLPGRRVAITFDDAYRDFLDHAWPLLRSYGFGASLFVVAGEIGGWNRWDRALGERLALLGANELRSLVAEGLDVGSHSQTHPRLSALDPAQVVHEALASRRTIEHELGVAPDLFAYPYGDVDGAVRRLVGACGYDIGLGVGGGRARLQHDVLDLPRLEVTGTTELEDFVRLVEGTEEVT